MAITNVESFTTPRDSLPNVYTNVTAREVDFVTRFGDNWDALRNIMGIMRPIRKTPGTVLKSFTASVALESGSVGPGKVIPYSKATIEQLVKGSVQTLFGLLQRSYGDSVFLVSGAVRIDVDILDRLHDLVEVSRHGVEAINDAHIRRPEIEHADPIPVFVFNGYFDQTVIYCYRKVRYFVFRHDISLPL